MTNAEIVSKLWNLCNVLRDDGITYHQYVTELTYILFLKMAKETGSEKNIPEQYRWDALKVKEGIELKRFYDELLRELGENCTGRVQEIYQGARSNIEEPANLKKIITNIDELDWYSAKEEGLGNLYEGLLEKNANENARAAVVLPDNVLFADGDGERIRRDLMEKCNLHTILRLPTGIFYAQGVKTNVLFFTRGTTDKDNTKEVWIYDLRNDMPSFGKTNPLKREHFNEFVECYAEGDLSKREETYSEENPNGRWRKYTIEDILARDKTSLDITWMKTDSGTDDYTLAELLDMIKEKSSNIAKAVAELEALIGEVEE